MKILIIRFSSIGDIVLTTPVVRCLKNQLKNAEIHYLTKKSYTELLEFNHNIDKLWFYENSLLQCLKLIRNQKFDLIIDLHNNLRTFIFKIFCNTKSVAFDKLNFRKFLLVNFKINKMPNLHIVDRYLNTVRNLGIINDGKGLDYFFSDETLKDKFNLIEKLGTDFICIAVGGQHFTKKLPIEKLQVLISSIKSKVVLIGDKEDAIEISKIADNLDENILNFTGKLTITQSALAISLCKILISHDTGMMHIAAALKKPVITVWGNTVPAFGMYPYYGKIDVFFENFEVQNLNCRPCSKIGFDKCPQKHFSCMNLQDIKGIAEKATNY
ncbi:MAG: glycosyltransferase family 9 protein [Bacteroidetes bacterium]|nr:glycosyltransferase family 9 protein [Bacteroidota bacterium]